MPANEALAHFLVKHSQDGLQQTLDYPKLRALGYSESMGEYERAAGKLDHDGFVTADDVTRAITLNYDLYWEFDEAVLGWSPIDDAAALARLALKALGSIGDKKEGKLQAEALHKASGWSLRRFNPAFAYLVEEFADDARSAPEQAKQGSYYVEAITITSKDIPGLKELAEG